MKNGKWKRLLSLLLVLVMCFSVLPASAFAENSSRNVAGTDQIGFVLTYMNIVNDANVYNLFEAKATELVSQPEEADLIVSDRKIDHLREDQEQIHSYDFEKILKYLNQ